MNTNSVYDLNCSSNFEPIYITDIDNTENINVNDNSIHFTVSDLNSNMYDNDADIKMEEFIKFKDKPSENVANNSLELDNTNTFIGEKEKQDDLKPFPQMPTSVQMEITGDVKEHEASFRNFFSQYRASLNLLYERH